MALLDPEELLVILAAVAPEELVLVALEVPVPLELDWVAPLPPPTSPVERAPDELEVPVGQYQSCCEHIEPSQHKRPTAHGSPGA